MPNIGIKIPWDKEKYQVFGAFPWDWQTRQMYEKVFRQLKKQHKDIKVRYGMKICSNNRDNAMIEEFMNRNKQMYEIFVKGIERSDIFIADVTKRNPNVMLELGIAMQLNKNILLLTSDKNDNYPFNIQGIRIETYSSIKDLLKYINIFIRLFKKITSQSFDSYIDSLCFKLDKPIILNDRENKIIEVGKMKNLKLKFNYRFLDHIHTADWIGIYLRTLGPERNNSELVYTRVNGQLESLTMPHLRDVEQGKEANIKHSEGEQLMQVEIIENKISATTNNKQLIDDNVMVEGFGEIRIGCWSHPRYPSALDAKKHRLKVEITNIQIISLDTTTSIF